MFQKKDVIYSETLGVCTVDDIVKLADSKKDTYSYYLLRSAFDRTKKAYIPVENHSVKLRELITKEEAQARKDSGDFEKCNELIKNEVAYVLDASDF